MEVLLQCRLCGGKVSSNALSCPHCGSRNYKPIDFLKREEEEQRTMFEKKQEEERERIEKEKDELRKKAEAKGNIVSVITVIESKWNGEYSVRREEWNNACHLKIDGKQWHEIKVYDGNNTDFRLMPGSHTAHYEEWDGWGHLVKSEQSFLTTTTTRTITVYIKEIRLLHKAKRIYRVEVT